MENKKVRLLLIEDDPEDVYLFEDYLARANGIQFEHESVSTLKAALAELGSKAFDVILMDLMLPDSQGIETFLRIHAEKPELPIVILTGLTDESLALDALSVGAQDYLVKGSLNAQVLRRTLAYAIERRQLLAQVESLIDRAADGMVVVDEEGIVRYVNAAAESLLDREAEEMLGKPFDYPARPGLSQELKIVLKNGETKIADMRAAAIEWKKTPACLASIRDITELRRIEQLKAEIHERRRLDQLKDEFISVVSHELRSPLAILKGALDNLKDGLLGSLTPKQAGVVELMNRNIRRMTRIINNLLDLSRLESGKAKINRLPLDLSALARETIEGFKISAGERRIELKAELPKDLPKVLADSDLVIEVLSNLLDNALRYARREVRVQAKVVSASVARAAAQGSEGPASTLTTARRDAQISVIDDGEGIPPAQMAELFDKFVQVQRSLGSGYKGTGLGLAICKEIVLRHNGNIWVESNPGGGAQFHFILPGASETEAGQAAAGQ